jgi:ribosomal protein S18 acetylase RimI-like enzyme
MIQLVAYASSDQFEDELKHLYVNSFPADERRDWEQLQGLANTSSFKFYKILDDNLLVGLITLWQWPDLTFIEHFAVVESLRGKGIGKEAIRLIIKDISHTVVLEVEEPHTESARRRINFYNRLGFHTCQDTYYQPPYHKEKNAVKMMLMSYPESLTKYHFNSIRARLYKEAYQCNITDFT